MEDLKLKETHYITLNGSRIYDRNWNEFQKHNLNTDVINNIKIENKEDVLYISLSDLKKIQTEDKLIDKSNRKFKNFKSIAKFQKDKNIVSILISNKEDKLIKYKDILLEKHNNINIFPSNPTTLEIVDINALKGVLKTYDISFDETIAFGNGFNDLDILTITKKGIITKNSNKNLKKLNKFEIIGSTIQEAVANYINEKILIKSIQKKLICFEYYLKHINFF